MNDDLTKKTVLIYDLSGSYTHIAEALVGKFGRVLYHSQFESGFTKVCDYLPGEGLDGIERVFDPADHYADLDLAIFPDVGLGGLQAYLRQQDIPVWGSGRSGNLERDRLALKVELQSRGLDVAEYEVIQGLSALREALADAPPCWIKISYFRGLSETYHHEDGFASQGWLDDLAVKLGPYQETLAFLVEQPIEGEAVEVGLDAYAVELALPHRMLWGFEQKDLAFLGLVSAPPPRLLEVARRFMPALAGYRGPLSNEIRVTKEQAYLTDLTARFPSPPSEIQCLGMTNFAEVAYHGARGLLLEPEYSHAYCAELVIASEVLEDHPLGLQIGMPERVAVHGHCRFDGQDYAASPLKLAEFAGAVGLGDSLEDAIAEAIEAAESIKGNQLKFTVAAFDELMETIQRGESLGLSWTVHAT